MKKLKNSLIAVAILTAIISLIALVTPMSGRGQGNGSPPARDVNVVNTPSVNVVNTATSPVLVRDVESGREPFQETTSILINSGIDHIQTIVFAVPEGKRCIIETVSAWIAPRGLDTPSEVDVSTRLSPNGPFGTHHIAVSKQALSILGEPVYVGTHYIKAYAGAGTSVVVSVSRSNLSDSLSASVTISGYFVDVP